MIKEHKKELLMIILVLLFVIVLIGVSYAAFSYTGRGEKVNTITTGAITMSYEETDNVINMSGALPTTDKTGMIRLTEGEYFDFKISSSISGNTNINYEISAKKEDGNTIDGSNIKLYLTEIVDGKEEALMVPEVYNEETSSNTYTGRPANEMSLYTSSMNSSEEHQYRLRMYVREEYNPQDDGGGLTFSVKINVYGKDGDVPPTPAGNTIIENLTSGDTYNDGYDTFITGENPNNYVWYSGKLWRAVSVNNTAKTTKLVTQWNISAIPYNASADTAFEGSYIEEWLNDTSIDGFLGNLRDYENFIVTDSVWDATLDATSLGSITRPNGTTTVTDAVGLLNMYEYQSNNNGGTNGYLNNGLRWWTLTPYSSSSIWYVQDYGNAYNTGPPNTAYGVRPTINLKSSVRIVEGDGTADNPYRLNGDNDTNLSGTMLSNRYSGEYIRFGNYENNLYRIVSHETEGLTKITSAKPLSSGTFITMNFGNTTTYSSTNTIGTFLNGDYLANYVDSSYSSMIEDSTTWYLGTVGDGVSYKLAKYTDTNMSGYATSTNAKVGLLRLGELMAGQFDRYDNNTDFWLLTPYNSSYVRCVSFIGYGDYSPLNQHGISPSLNLKQNVVITGGLGTKEQPFEIELAS